MLPALFAVAGIRASDIPIIKFDPVFLRDSEASSSALVLSALVIVPQILVALWAPWMGRQAKAWGRRPLLLIGFGALPIRALLFSVITDPVLLVGVQLLDGVSGTVLGVLQALVIADLTRGSGRFNLIQGLVGAVSGVRASMSTTLFGLIAQTLGRAGGLPSSGAWRLLSCGFLCRRRSTRFDPRSG